MPTTRPTLESVTAMDGETPSPAYLQSLQALWDATNRPRVVQRYEPGTLSFGGETWVKNGRTNSRGEALYSRLEA